MSTFTFEPLRREELRIMGYGDVVFGDGGENPGEAMAKEIKHDGPIDVTRGRVEAHAGDFIVEYANGATEHLTPGEWENEGYVLLPPEPTTVDEPVPLAEPAGLLQREDAE